MHWQMVFIDEARQEFNQLPAREQSAMIHALDKLRSEGTGRLGLEFHIDVTRPTCAFLRERP